MYHSDLIFEKLPVVQVLGVYQQHLDFRSDLKLPKCKQITTIQTLKSVITSAKQFRLTLKMKIVLWRVSPMR
jgi:hypothetical protein